MLHVTNIVSLHSSDDGPIPFSLTSSFSFADAVPPPKDADYWWFIENWGTSMDAQNVRTREDNSISFETRWWAPLEWMERLSALHPTLICDLYWVDTSLACGHYTVKASVTQFRAYRVPSVERTAFLETYFPRAVSQI